MEIKPGSVLKGEIYTLKVLDIILLSGALYANVRLIESGNKIYPIGWEGSIPLESLKQYEVDNTYAEAPKHKCEWQKYHGFTEKYRFCECGEKDYTDYE